MLAPMTRGRAELLLVLQRTRAEFVAARCRVTAAAVYNWTSGRRKPDDDARMALFTSYGIAPEAWDERRLAT